MIERLAFGFLGQRPKQTKTPLPLAEWLGLALGGEKFANYSPCQQADTNEVGKGFFVCYRRADRMHEATSPLVLRGPLKKHAIIHHHFIKDQTMANTTTQKDYSKLTERQIFNLMLNTKEKIKKIQKEKASFQEKLTKELERKLEKNNKSLNSKLETLNEALKQLNAVFDQKRLNDCCFGHETPNIRTQEAMRDALNGENLETIEDLSAWANEVKREVNAEN